MKKWIVFFLLLLSNIFFAQQSDNSQVDLRAVFNQQIERIKQKQFSSVHDTKTATKNNSVSSKAVTVKKSAATSVKLASKPAKRKSTSKESNIVLLKIFVLFEASLLAGIIVMYRRKKIGHKKLENRELKENIKKLREEKLIVTEDVALNNLRKSLSSKNIPLENGAKGITLLAKKLSIAKGEVYLAAKISLLASK